jgi:hypothetical protein
MKMADHNHLPHTQVTNEGHHLISQSVGLQMHRYMEQVTQVIVYHSPKSCQDE